MKDFWFITLCVLLIIASVIGWNIPVRIAVAANAVLILADVVCRIWRLHKNGKREKN